MMDAFDLASRLFGSSRAESRGDVSNSLDILTATGAGDSSDGAATVYLDADVTPADDYEGDDYAIGIPTSPNVIDGDGVLVGLTGSGPLKTPVVISNPGSGDRMQAQVDNAETLAQQAEAVATATGQHFWPDDNGVHVTEVTQEGWSDSTSPDYHSGANVLLNALGQLFRDGLNNLLAIVTNGIAIYDGNGNEDGNILAKFYTFVLNNHQHARIDFFNGKGFIDYDSNNNELHISARDDSTANVHMNTARINLYQSVDNKISNLEILAGANGAAPPAFIQLDSRNPSGGPSESTIYAYASELLLGYDGDSGSATIPMPQAIAALSQPFAVFSGANGTSNATGTGWRLTYFNTTQSNSGNWSDYFTNSNGVITAKRNIRLEISGCMNWADSVAGLRGFGVFYNSSTAGSGTEYSEFAYFPSNVQQRKSVWMAGLVLNLSAGTKCAFGRYEQSGAVYQTGTNFSRVELKVLGTY